MSSSVNPGNSSQASKHSKGNTDFGASHRRPDASQSEMNYEAVKAPMNSDDNMDRESHQVDFGVQNEPENEDREALQNA